MTTYRYAVAYLNPIIIACGMVETDTMAHLCTLETHTRRETQPWPFFPHI